MPNRYRVIILPNATTDLVQTCSRIEQDSPQDAGSVATRPVAAVDSLEELQHRYEVHQHRTDPALTVRSMAVPPFIIYYRIDDTRYVVRILAIGHGGRRQPKRFK